MTTSPVLVDPERLRDDGLIVANLALLVADTESKARRAALLVDLGLDAPASLRSFEERCELLAEVAISRAETAMAFEFGLPGSIDEWADPLVQALWDQVASTNDDLIAGPVAWRLLLEHAETIDADGNGRLSRDEMLSFACDNPFTAAGVAAQNLASNDFLWGLGVEESYRQDPWELHQGAVSIAGLDALRLRSIELVAMTPALSSAIASGDADFEYNGVQYEVSQVLIDSYNLEIYAHDPDAAFRLIELTDSYEIPGSELPLAEMSDSGLMATFDAAQLAIAGHGIVALGDLVAMLPESEGGVRAQIFIDTYARLDQMLMELLGLEGVEHLWPGGAAIAVLSILPAIDGRQKAFLWPVPNGWSEEFARANSSIASSMLPHLTGLAELLDDGAPTSDQIEQFLNSFGPGEGLLQTSFAYLIAAGGTDDPAEQRSHATRAAALMTAHEQALIQPNFDALHSLSTDAAAGLASCVGGDCRTADEILTDDAILAYQNIKIDAPVTIPDGTDPGDLNPMLIMNEGLAGTGLAINYGEIDMVETLTDQAGLSLNPDDWLAALDENGMPNDWTVYDERMYHAIVHVVRMSEAPDLFDWLD